MSNHTTQRAPCGHRPSSPSHLSPVDVWAGGNPSSASSNNGGVLRNAKKGMSAPEKERLHHRSLRAGGGDAAAVDLPRDAITPAS
mgnify:CR=1 FL=1